MRYLFVGWFSATADRYFIQHWRCRKRSFVTLFPQTRMQKSRRRLWVFFWLLALGLFAFPINNLPLRLGTIVVTLCALAWLLFLSRKHKPILIGMLSAFLACGIFLICPGKTPDPLNLRDAYVRSLRTYEGTRYIWGGENRLGIDCSGLVRAALIKANFEQGLLALNPQLIRHAVSLWWNDSSAKAMGEGYRGLTRRILQTSNIK